MDDLSDNAIRVLLMFWVSRVLIVATAGAGGDLQPLLAAALGPA